MDRRDAQSLFILVLLVFTKPSNGGVLDLTGWQSRYDLAASDGFKHRR